eukprot:353090-Chlamydomonas_euryale.AAC.9
MGASAKGRLRAARTARISGSISRWAWQGKVRSALRARFATYAQHRQHREMTPRCAECEVACVAAAAAGPGVWGPSAQVSPPQPFCTTLRLTRTPTRLSPKSLPCYSCNCLILLFRTSNLWGHGGRGRARGGGRTPLGRPSSAP